MDFPAPAPFLAAPGEPTTPWATWISQFDNYLLAIGGDSFPVARQKAILLHCLGCEGQRIHSTLPVTPKLEGESDLDYTKRVLAGFFGPKCNVVGERYRFRSRAQRADETTAQWVSVLRQLAATCDYGDRCEEFVRDQVVEKTSSATLRQRLLMEENLTLAKTLSLAESVETASREAKVLAEAPPAQHQPVHLLQPHPQGVRRRTPAVPRQGSTARRVPMPTVSRASPAATPGSSARPTCFCCGGDHFAKDPVCPARVATCHNCGKKGHFASVCKGKRSARGARVVHSLQILSVGCGTQLRVPVCVDARAVDMVVDTGSPVTLLPRAYVPHLTLQRCEETLQAYGGSQVQVLGKGEVQMTFKGSVHSVTVYVVPHGVPIMGLDVMSVLGVNVVNNTVCHVSQDLPSTPAPASGPEDGAADAPAPILGFEHRVTVNPDIPPVRQPPRRLPWAIRDQVNARISELERQGVIEPVTASEWVSPLVVGRKRNGDLRLCVDLRQVNRAVVTDGYPLPHMEDMLHNLRGSDWYTKLDLKDAYHQVVLNEASRNLTGFRSWSARDRSPHSFLYCERAQTVLSYSIRTFKRRSLFSEDNGGNPGRPRRRTRLSRRRGGACAHQT